MYVCMHVRACNYVCMYVCVCMHACMHACKHACVCMYACMYVCLCVCVYACMCVHTHICVCHICRSIYLCYRSIYRSIYLSIDLYIYLTNLSTRSVYLSIYLIDRSIYPSIYLSIYLYVIRHSLIPNEEHRDQAHANMHHFACNHAGQSSILPWICTHTTIATDLASLPVHMLVSLD